MLGETPTTILFSLPSLVGASDTRDVMVLDERNARYEEVSYRDSNTTDNTANATAITYTIVTTNTTTRYIR